MIRTLDKQKQYTTVGGLGDISSPFSGAVHDHPQYLSQGDASGLQNSLNPCQDGAVLSFNDAMVFNKEMVIDCDNFLHFSPEQGLFYGSPITPAQPLPSDASVLSQQYQLQPSASISMFQFDNSQMMQSLNMLPVPDFSVLSQEAMGVQHQFHYPAAQFKSSFPLPSEPLQFYQNVFAETTGLDFSEGYHPFREHLPSPDGSISTGSEQGYFEVLSGDGRTYLPDYSYPPAVAAYGTESDFLVKSFEQLGLPVISEGQPTAPVAIPARGLHGPVPHLAHDSISPSTSASHKSSLPAMPSPLKQQFTGYISDESSDSEEESKPKRKKRVRKAVTTKSLAKPKGIKPVLRCEFPGCKVTCSSTPSLMRHSETHKWRGKYSPVRCEACLNPLSNEFSVQRHIMRSPDSTLCKKMRVYSIMRSATDVETTVRFYPTRGHGKKTKVVDLAMMRKKFI
ncbi:hypothetical protein EC968_003343 [Mortierella alpina]|nr:hypothetical protein EC968_003343 [Mortierella alpina]